VLAGLVSIGPRYKTTRYRVVVKREVNQQTTFSQCLVLLNHALELAVFKPPGFRPNQIHQNHANGKKTFAISQSAGLRNLVSSVVDPDSHHFGNPEPHPHQIKIRIRILIRIQ
jgi:hypothetical protein